MEDKNTLIGCSVIFGAIFMIAAAVAVDWLIPIRPIYDFVKIDDLLNIEASVKKAGFVYLYFILIWLLYYVLKENIKRRLLKEWMFNKQIDDRKYILKKTRIVVFLIFGICLTIFISWFLSYFLGLDFYPAYIFFIILPVVIYGINTAIDEVQAMTTEEKKNAYHN